MKKRTIILILLVSLLTCILSGCGDSFNMSYAERAEKANETTIDNAGFKRIEGNDYLAYNADTQVIYYMFSSGQSNGYSYTYFAPYISENGNFCRYVDGQIVEITEQTSKTVN